jgi:putative oxidoreductase
MEPTRSSHPALSYADGIAARTNDFLLLVARVLLVAVLFLFAWSGSPNPGYLSSLGLAHPVWSLVAIAFEFVVAITVVFGIATRYGALLGLLYVFIATALAHRYWEYPQAQQLAQYTNFTKNLAIFGGLLFVFVWGPGRFSIDRMLSGKRDQTRQSFDLGQPPDRKQRAGVTRCIAEVHCIAAMMRLQYRNASVF